MVGIADKTDRRPQQVVEALMARPSAGASAPPRSPRTGRLRLAVGVAIGVGAVYTVVSSAGGFAHSLQALSSANGRWLGASAAAEALSFAILGVLLRRLTGGHVRPLVALRLGLLVAGLGNVLPAAPAEGLALAGAEMRRRGVEARRTRITLGLMQWYSVRAIFALVALDALVVVAVAGTRFPGPDGARVRLAAIAVGVLVLLAATAWLASRRRTVELIAVLAGSVAFWKPSEPIDVRRERGTTWHNEIHEVLGSGPNQARLAALALCSCLANGACFRYSMIAVGVHLPAEVFLLAYGVGMIAALVPLVPAGLGVAETVVPALLHRAGVPVATALAGVLAFRVLGTLAPAVSGTIALVRLRLTNVAPSAHAVAIPEQGPPTTADPIESALQLDQPAGHGSARA